MIKSNFLRLATRCLIMVFSLVTLTSCYTTETFTVSLEKEYKNTYRNWTKRQLLSRFGAPDRTVPISGSAEILVYEKFNTIGLAVEGLAVSKRHRRYTEFYCDENERCYDVKTNAFRTEENSEFSKGKTIGLVCGLTSGIASFIAMLMLIAK